MLRKKCSKCLSEKLIQQFYRCKRSRDGRMHACKECKKKEIYENRELKKEIYKEKKKIYDAQPHVVAKRLEYARSPAGRATQRRHRRWRKLTQSVQVSS